HAGGHNSYSNPFPVLRTLLSLSVQFMRSLNQFLDHLLQKHAVLAADSILIILQNHLMDVFFEQLAATFQYLLIHVDAFTP
ncbi:TPA: hypothetical protein ACG3KH_004314, partial [Clostridioides difficile]